MALKKQKYKEPEIMTIKINREYWESKVKEMPKDFLIKAVEFVKKELSEKTKEEIRKVIETQGIDDWIAGYHFNWGMAMRNALRDAGFSDDELPDKNWDDYYHQVIEIALGMRELPSE